jgi:hypothetical protein
MDERTTPIANSFVQGLQSNLPQASTFTRADFWAHGLNVGFECRY